MKIFEKITKKDLSYIIAILVVILIGLYANFLGNDELANNNINFAATVVSIILGVIAILYTLMDSTGQKENVADMKRMIDDMKNQAEQLTDAAQASASVIELIRKLEERMNDSYDSNMKYFTRISNILEQKENSESTDRITELKRIVDIALSENKKNNKEYTDQKLKNINSILLRKLEFFETYEKNYLIDLLLNNTNLKREEAKELIEKYNEELDLENTNDEKYTFYPF